MKKSVKDYLREIETIYKTTAAKVAEDYDEQTKLKEEINRVRASKEYTASGKSKRIDEINEKIKSLSADMYALRTNANNKAKEIRKNLDKEFFKYFHANAGDVDMQMVALINAGVLSDTELLRYSENANVTMKRLIGRALEESKEGKYVNEGRQLRAISTEPHLRAADGVIGIGEYACGGARLSGASGAKTYLKRWDELVSPIINSAPNVSWNMDILKPGEITFTED